MLDPRALAQILRGFEPSVGPDDVGTAVAVDVSAARAEGAAFFGHDVLDETRLALGVATDLVPDGNLGVGKELERLAVADDVHKGAGSCVPSFSMTCTGQSPGLPQVFSNQNEVLLNQAPEMMSGRPS
jgi:hypothetical protein